MSEERFANQEKIINANKLAETRFVVVGAGAIGSAFVLGLSKMGARNVTLYDFDILENHNFANQLHPVSQLGKAKVDSLVAVAKDYGDCTVTPVNAPWTTGNAVDADVVVSCVDNMDVRAALWKHYKSKNVFFIDGRMSAFVFKVFGVDAVRLAGGPVGIYSDSSAEAMSHYEGTLHSQASASIEPCGEKSIIFTVLVMAGMMLDQVKKYLNNEYRPTETVGDLYNLTMTHKYHMEPQINTVYAEEENTAEEQKRESQEIPQECQKPLLDEKGTAEAEKVAEKESVKS